MNGRRQILAVALALLCAASTPAPARHWGQAPADEEPVELSTELVVLPVTVRGKEGRPVGGLTAVDFEVFEDGKRVAVEQFSSVERPLRIVVLFDTSLSMESTLPGVRQEAQAFVDALRPHDRVSVSWFAIDAFTDVQWLDQAQARQRIASVLPAPKVPTAGAVGEAVPDANTHLYDALLSLLDRFGPNSDPVAAIVFSDGIDTSGGRSARNRKRKVEGSGSAVVDQAQATWVCFYPVRYKTEQMVGGGKSPRVFGPVLKLPTFGKGKRDDPGAKFFDKLASASGGSLFEYTTQQDLAKALAKALDELRNQYVIAYVPPAGGKRIGYHEIGVRARCPGCAVRTRPGYSVSDPGR